MNHEQEGLLREEITSEAVLSYQLSNYHLEEFTDELWQEFVADNIRKRNLLNEGARVNKID